MDKNKHQDSHGADQVEETQEAAPTDKAEQLETSPEELINQFKDQWMRAVAENENLRRRFEKEKEETFKYAITKFARDVLNIADNLQRALETCPPQPEGELKALVEGLKLVENECNTIFERHGIAKVGTMGETFNPEIHQAMFEVPVVEGAAIGTVAQVMQSGYMLQDRLLRPALVGVYKAG